MHDFLTMATTTSATPPSVGSSSTAATSSLTDAKAFRYPPIHAFPPFYTIQPNPISRAQQLSQWRALVLDYCRHYRIFSLSPLPSSSSDLDAVADPHKTLFANQSIQRCLSPESIRQILADLVDHKQAVWEDQLLGKKSSASNTTNAKVFVYWKTPVQWADAIYDWVMATGQNKSIMTLFELNQGESVQAQGRFIPRSRY